jgi:hypothetical protein
MHRWQYLNTWKLRRQCLWYWLGFWAPKVIEAVVVVAFVLAVMLQIPVHIQPVSPK